MGSNRGLSNGPVPFYVKSFNEELHMTPHMVTKRRCVWNKTFPLGHFMLHFTTFIMLYMYEMTTKARIGEVSEVALSCKCNFVRFTVTWTFKDTLMSNVIMTSP